MSEPITAFDVSRIFLNDYPVAFLAEVAIRACVTFILCFIFLRLIGRRGVKQMTSLELIILLTLGSAAGDIAFYPEVAVVPILITFVVVFALYYLFSIILSQFKAVEGVLAGKPEKVIVDGVMVWKVIENKKIMYRELLMELREEKIDHFGQVKLGILETDGNVSVYFFEDEDVKPGLSVLPNEFIESSKVIETEGYYSCTRCSNTCFLTPRDQMKCNVCQNLYWAESSQNHRIT
jgi:uncharacterized membrane protein YcaP (DUF421 family)